MVRTNTIVLAGMGAAVVRVKGTPRALAMSTDGNGRYCYLDPRRGAMLAVAEAARNVACAGGRPIGATNCLNFGNPERADIMWQFAEAVEGLAEACSALEIPITGGNVSLYNETDGKAILPTPIIGVVGLIEDAAAVLGRAFRAEGRDIVLLGDNDSELGGTEYLKVMHGRVAGAPPRLDLSRERALIDLLVRAAAGRLIESAHDCSDGGLAVALAECTFDAGGLGCRVDVPAPAAGEWQVPGVLFSEAAGRVVVSVKSELREALLEMAGAAAVPARVIGRTGGDRLVVTVEGAGAIDCAVSTAEEVWSSALGRFFAARAA
jgi:phosphoribosylformylglycinamidine synthase